MQIKRMFIFYMCHLFDHGLCDTKSAPEISTLKTPYSECNLNACPCDVCKSNVDQRYCVNITKMISTNGQSHNACPGLFLSFLNEDEVCFCKVCVANYSYDTSEGKKSNCFCTVLNCTDFDVTATSASTEQTVENYSLPITVTRSPNYNFDAKTTDESDGKSKSLSILIGLIVGMVLLFILLLITILVIWRLRSRAKTRASMANKGPQLSTLTHTQKSLTTRIQPLENIEDTNIYHQLDNSYGDSGQMSQNATMFAKKRLADQYSPIIETSENGTDVFNTNSVPTSITPKGSQEINSDSNTIEGTTYFILEEEVKCDHDSSIAEKDAKGSYFVLENDDIIESSLDAALPGDSVSRPDGYSRFRDITRRTANEYDTFVKINENNSSVNHDNLDRASKSIETIYDMAKSPILQEVVLNTGAEMLGSNDSKCPKFEADQKDYTDPNYFVLESTADDIDSTRMSSVETQEAHNVTNYSRLREVSPVFQHDYNTLSRDTKLADIAISSHAND